METSAGMPIAELVRRASDTLAQAGIADPIVDVELLTAHVLGVSRGGVQAAALRGDVMDAEAVAQVDALIARRRRREPLQHLTGRAPFRHLELLVGPGVFVPRPETEILAQIAIDALRAAAAAEPIAVDLGTGSGAIALSLATEVAHARVFAVELSEQAYVWARRNADAVGAANLEVRRGDLQDALPELDGQVSVVVSNPPYVPDDAIPRDPEVRDWDPAAALFGGADGLDVVRTLAVTGRRLAHPGGLIAIEHGEWQGAAVREILADASWRAAATHPDLTGRDRVTTAIRS